MKEDLIGNNEDVNFKIKIKLNLSDEINSVLNTFITTSSELNESQTKTKASRRKQTHSKYTKKFFKNR